MAKKDLKKEDVGKKEASKNEATKKDVKKWITDLFWPAGVAVIITLLAIAPGSISKWSIVVLVLLGGLFFSTGVFEVGWIKRPQTVLEAMKTLALFILIWGGMIGLGRAIWPRDQGRHLTPEQIEEFAKARDNLPKNCGMLVYVPIESVEAQNYGKEIQNALQMHGGKANLIYAGAKEPSTGIVIGVRSTLEPCGFAGEALSLQITNEAHIPARLRENFPYADNATIIVDVGLKPSYD